MAGTVLLMRHGSGKCKRYYSGTSQPERGVSHQSRSAYYLGSTPAWWLRIVLGSFAGLLGGNLWNRLVGLGWKLARLHGGSWRKLLPYNSVIEEVAERIAREPRFGRWLEVFGPPPPRQDCWCGLGPCLLDFREQYKHPSPQD